jgi:prepilin-type N-terminal cleavage/methylation domain-containing protein
MKALTPPRRAGLPGRRAGFTMIELMVVIAIIALLASLLLGAIAKVRDVAERTKAISDLNNLNMAATKFKTDFGFLPPDYVRLPGQVPDPTWAGAAAGSAQRETYDGYTLLLKMFPRWQIPGVGAAASAPQNPAAVGQSTGLSFLGTAVPSGGTPLQGSQCLVFFLGGPNLQGFTPGGPYPPAVGALSAKGPYYDFPTARIDPSANAVYKGGFLDPYGVPYAFFSSGGSRAYTSRAWVPPAPEDGPAYSGPVTYYKETSGQPVNMTGIQIISAGKDGRFGLGGAWTPGAAGYTAGGVPPASDGADDLANFNGGSVLGVSGS